MKNCIKRITFLLVILVLGTAVSRAYEEHVTSWPTKGLVSHWDLHVDYEKDLVSGAKRDTTDCRRFYGHQNTYVSNNWMTLSLPSDMWEEHNPHTVLLRLVNYIKADLEELRISLPIRLSADDDALNFTLFHDSLLVGAQKEYELPLLWIPYSSRETSSREAVIAVFIECLNHDTLRVRLPDTYAGKTNYFPIRVGVAAKNKYIMGYTGMMVREEYPSTMGIQCKTGLAIGSVKSIDFNEVAIYDRILTPEEIQAAIGAEDMKVITPEDYKPYFGWTIIPYSVLALILFFIIIVSKMQKYSYITPSRLQHSMGPRDKEKAYSLMEQASACFTSKKGMIVPHGNRLELAEKCLNDAIKNGYYDEKIIVEYNRIASLINYCNGRGNSNISMGLTFAVPILIFFGMIVTGYHFGSYFSIWGKQEMYPYYLTSLLCVLMAQLMPNDLPDTISSDAVEWLKPNLLNRIGESLGGIMSAVAGSTVSGISVVFVFIRVALWLLLYAFALGLKVLVSCIFEFVIVVANTGKVVATGVGGLSIGIVGGIVAFCLFWWLLFKLVWIIVNGLLWISIPGIGAFALLMIVMAIIAFVNSIRMR